MDDVFEALRHAPHPALPDDLDDRVMTALSARQCEATASQRFMALAAMVSLGGGALVGVVMGEPASAARPLSPFAPATVLAPSTLLDPR